MKWFWISLSLLLLGSWVTGRVYTACGVNHLDGKQCISDLTDGLTLDAQPTFASLTFHQKNSNGLYSSLNGKALRKSGMPTRMWPIEKDLIDSLSKCIGKTVYLMPKKQSYKAEPIATTVMAVYTGIEIGDNGEPVLVGAVILAKDYNNYGAMSHHQQSFLNTLELNSGNISYTSPSVSCSFDALTNPNKVYLDKHKIYAKLLAIYEKKLQDNTTERDDYQTQMDKDKEAIESAIEKQRNLLKGDE